MLVLRALFTLVMATGLCYSQCMRGSFMPPSALAADAPEPSPYSAEVMSPMQDMNRMGGMHKHGCDHGKLCTEQDKTHSLQETSTATLKSIIGQTVILQGSGVPSVKKAEGPHARAGPHYAFATAAAHTLVKRE